MITVHGDRDGGAGSWWWWWWYSGNNDDDIGDYAEDTGDYDDDEMKIRTMVMKVMVVTTLNW